MKSIIELIEFTDPYCTWCWGSEPILRRIQETYGRQVSISFVMGGLTDNADQVNDPANGIGGTDWKRQVAEHWLDASSRHGMPVDISGFVEKVAPKSTYPANIAFEAARIQAPEKADSYLRRLREAAATENRSIHLQEVQADIAEELGLNRAQFLSDLSGPAKEAFADDQRQCLAYGARGFPTFLIRSERGERLLRGYNRFVSFAAVFDELAFKPLDRKNIIFNDEAVLAFINKYGSSATREVAEVFGVEDSAADMVLLKLVSNGEIEKRSAGTGSMYLTLKSGGYCDTLTGKCL